MRAFVLEVTRGEEDTGYATLAPPDEGAGYLVSGDSPSAPFAFDDAATSAFLESAVRRERRSQVPALEAAANGLLPIRDHGCGEYDCVVLTGPQRGKMWKWFEEGLLPIHDVKKGKAQQVDYLTWVERELQDALRSAPPAIRPTAKEIDLSVQGLTTIPPEVFSAVAALRPYQEGGPRAPRRAPAAQNCESSMG